MNKIVEYALTRQHEDRQKLSKVDQLKAQINDVGREVTLMGESYDGFALAEKTVEAAVISGRKIYEHYRKRMQEPPRRLKETAPPLQKKDFALTTE